jgi:hypothetical protein
MKKKYEVVTFTGKTWENLNNNEFTSQKKAQAHLTEWQKAAPGEKHKIIVHGG